jgi:hypothetical protein
VGVRFELCVIKSLASGFADSLISLVTIICPDIESAFEELNGGDILKRLVIEKSLVCVIFSVSLLSSVGDMAPDKL